MVDLLLDGRDHSVRTLAQAAGIALSTASEHVGRLERGGIVVSRRAGRERLVRLAGSAAAAAYEGLAELSRDELLQKIWGRRESHRDRTVDVFVRRLREKIDRHASRHTFIQTRYGVGYKLEAVPK